MKGPSILRAQSHGGLVSEDRKLSASEEVNSTERSSAWKGWAMVALACGAVVVYVWFHKSVLVTALSGLFDAIG